MQFRYCNALGTETPDGPGAAMMLAQPLSDGGWWAVLIDSERIVGGHSYPTFATAVAAAVVELEEEPAR